MGKNKVGRDGRDSKTRSRWVDDNVVIPASYDGTTVGRGKFMTGMVNNKIVEDKNGCPLPLRKIGELR